MSTYATTKTRQAYTEAIQRTEGLWDTTSGLVDKNTTPGNQTITRQLNTVITLCVELDNKISSLGEKLQAVEDRLKRIEAAKPAPVRCRNLESHWSRIRSGITGEDKGLVTRPRELADKSATSGGRL